MTIIILAASLCTYDATVRRSTFFYRTSEWNPHEKEAGWPLSGSCHELDTRAVTGSAYLRSEGRGGPSCGRCRAGRWGWSDPSAGIQAGTRTRWTGPRWSRHPPPRRSGRARGQGTPAAHRLEERTTPGPYLNPGLFIYLFALNPDPWRWTFKFREAFYLNTFSSSIDIKAHFPQTVVRGQIFGNSCSLKVEKEDLLGQLDSFLWS